MLKRIFAACLLLCSTLTHTTSYWNWSRIDVNSINFPQSFIWGTTIIAREVEGNSTNDTFSAYAGRKNRDGKIFQATPVGKACDYWNRYKEDIDLWLNMALPRFVKL